MVDQASGGVFSFAGFGAGDRRSRRGRVLALVVVLLGAALIVELVAVTRGPGLSGRQGGGGNNLMNALTEASALYQEEGESFTTSVVASFDASAPEFAWTPGACGPRSPSNCLSYDVLDAAVPGDDQAIVLADRAENTGTCWYLVEVEVDPHLPVVVGHGSHDLDIAVAGVWIADAVLARCAASDPVRDGFHHWGPTFAQAPGDP